jgi:hypothetical protein
MFNTLVRALTGGWDSSVSIATRYRMEGPGYRTPVWGTRISAPVQTGPCGPTQPRIQWVPGLSPGVKRPGRGADSPNPY